MAGIGGRDVTSPAGSRQRCPQEWRADGSCVLSQSLGAQGLVLDSSQIGCQAILETILILPEFSLHLEEGRGVKLILGRTLAEQVGVLGTHLYSFFFFNIQTNL